MKVCKKCKRHVANKIKICKYCGADVSKAKIIKNGNVKKVNSISKKVAPIVQKNNNVKLYTDSSNKKTNNLKNSSKKEKRGIFGLKNSESKKLFKGSIFLKLIRGKKKERNFLL